VLSYERTLRGPCILTRKYVLASLWSFAQANRLFRRRRTMTGAEWELRPMNQSIDQMLMFGSAE